MVSWNTVLITLPCKIVNRRSQALLIAVVCLWVAACQTRETPLETQTPVFGSGTYPDPDAVSQAGESPGDHSTGEVGSAYPGPDELIANQEEVLGNLREKSLGYNLDKITYDIWELTARFDDLVKIGPSNYEVGEQISKGFMVLQYPPQESTNPGPSKLLLDKVDAVTVAEDLDPDQILVAAGEVHEMGKQFVVAPTGSRLLRWDLTTIQSIAAEVDVFVVQAQRWLVEDLSPGKDIFIGNILHFSDILRESNPEIKIFVEVGRRADRGGGTAEEWLHALSLLYQTEPDSFDGIYLFITRQETSPDQGYGALQDMVAALRPGQ
jgi:hypothetical protein